MSDTLIPQDIETLLNLFALFLVFWPGVWILWLHMQAGGGKWRTRISPNKKKQMLATMTPEELAAYEAQQKSRNDAVEARLTGVHILSISLGALVLTITSLFDFWRDM